MKTIASKTIKGSSISNGVKIFDFGEWVVLAFTDRFGMPDRVNPVGSAADQVGVDFFVVADRLDAD
jgi:hypothetical protein